MFSCLCISIQTAVSVFPSTAAAMSSSDKEEPLPITFADVQAAMERIRQHVAHTPVMECSYFNSQSRFKLYFKCENFQSTGAFKVIISSYSHHCWPSII